MHIPHPTQHQQIQETSMISTASSLMKVKSKSKNKKNHYNSPITLSPPKEALPSLSIPSEVPCGHTMPLPKASTIILENPLILSKLSTTLC
jgi:hypothetical protein